MFYSILFRTKILDRSKMNAHVCYVVLVRYIMPKRISFNLRCAIQVDYMRATTDIPPVKDVFRFHFPRGF